MMQHAVAIVEDGFFGDAGVARIRGFEVRERGVGDGKAAAVFGVGFGGAGGVDGGGRNMPPFPDYGFRVALPMITSESERTRNVVTRPLLWVNSHVSSGRITS